MQPQQLHVAIRKNNTMYAGLGNRQEAFSKDCWQVAIDMVMFLFILALTC